MATLCELDGFVPPLIAESHDNFDGLFGQAFGLSSRDSDVGITHTTSTLTGGAWLRILEADSDVCAD